jgi:integrase
MSGHIRRRGERSFELKYDVGTDPLTGKRRTRFSTFKGSKKAARIELARLVSEHAAGNSVDPSKATVGEFLAAWLNDWTIQNTSALTHKRYEAVVRLYVIPRLGNLPVQKLKPQHLQNFYAELGRSGGANGRPLLPRTIKLVHKVLSRALGHALTWATITTNPAKAVKAPPVPHSEVQILTADQISHLLKAAEGHELRPLFVFLLGTGARRAEALALTWRDINLDRGTVTIKASLEQLQGRQLRVKQPKTKSGVRSIALSPWLITELRAHRANQQEQRLGLGMGRAPDDSPVFAQWNGEWRTPGSVSDAWAKLAAKLGFPEVVLHALRHTHVSQLIAAGADVVTVSRRIGHASPAITLSVYAHLFGSNDQAAADITEAMFRKATQ